MQPDRTQNSVASVNAIPAQDYKDISFESLPTKFPTRSAVKLDKELEHIRIAVAQGYPSIQLEPLKDGWIDIVGYGPSLKRTWDQVRNPCITVSGAHDFLIERGVVPTYHAECDGRSHKPKHLSKPHKGVTYLMATVCHPDTWLLLDGFNVVTWHNANGMHVVEWIGENDPDKILVAGGSVVGLSAIHLAGILGFRKFRLFGMDCNFEGDDRHAGPHYGPPQRIVERRVGERVFKTTPQMCNSSDELGFLMKRAPQIEIEIVGDSMLRAMYGAKPADA